MNIKNRFTTQTLSLSDEQNIKWKQFANWLRTISEEKTPKNWCFLTKFFDIDSVLNSENEGV